MRDLQDSPREYLVYRRVPPHHWSDRGGILKIKPDAFLPSPQEGLSVFHAQIAASPRSILEDHVNRQIFSLQDANLPEGKRQKIEARIANRTMNVEQFYEDGWRVVVLPASTFPKGVFRFGIPTEDGHFEIFGDIEEFQRHAPELVRAARMLTEQECLGSP